MSYNKEILVSCVIPCAELGAAQLEAALAEN